ncbi:MAG TPA: hypothetical protein DEV93_01475 [Chloroflexi bacterium]|jgi:predicted small integral membrane protein|nr:hypothetical protein [Chloroflexota bacterium]
MSLGVGAASATLVAMVTIPPLHELIAFFEAEPTLLDPGVDWHYNTLTFDTTRGTDRVMAVLDAGYISLKFEWTRAERPVVSLHCQEISELRIETPEAGTERLLARFTDKAISDLVLSLKPEVSVFWGNKPGYVR